MSDAKWVTRDRRILLVRDMESEHIANCVRMIMRKTRRVMLEQSLSAMAYACSSMTPDGASMAAESESVWLSEKADSPAEQFAFALMNYPVVYAMSAELTERNYSKEGVWPIIT